MEWPRIPLPGWPVGDTPGAAEELAASAARGMELAALLDSDTPVPSVTTGALRPEMAAIAVPTTTDGGYMAGRRLLGDGRAGATTGRARPSCRARAEPLTSARSPRRERAALGERG